MLECVAKYSTKEIAGNGIDDDNNGYIDDVHGISAINQSGDPLDVDGHGTHVAGIIAARSNSIGVVGVAPGVKVQPIRVLGTNGGASSDLIAAIHWAAGISVGGVPNNPTPARVINLSIGTDTPTSCDAGTQAAVRAAWDRGVTPVTAAGNSTFEAAVRLND